MSFRQIVMDAEHAGADLNFSVFHLTLRNIYRTFRYCFYFTNFLPCASRYERYKRYERFIDFALMNFALRFERYKYYERFKL